jgi:transposase, IS5 family
MLSRIGNILVVLQVHFLRIEYVFGVQAMVSGSLIMRCIGIIRARIKIGLRNLAYNINRYGMLGVCRT